jgi:hypothetical protein
MPLDGVHKTNRVRSKKNGIRLFCRISRMDKQQGAQGRNADARPPPAPVARIQSVGVSHKRENRVGQRGPAEGPAPSEHPRKIRCPLVALPPVDTGLRQWRYRRELVPIGAKEFDNFHQGRVFTDRQSAISR